ncbi:MAG: hypothetical protein IKM59_06860 [Oscillospiraceae bacterium]|nr:hypothetical protein [Oscillospiraceae bacterium]
MKSLCKTAKALDTVFKIFRVFVIIALVASLVGALFVGGILLFDLDTELLGVQDVLLKLGPVTLTLAAADAVPLQSVLGASLADLAVLVILSVASLFAIKYIRAIVQPMTEGEPFRREASANLQKLAWLTVIYGVIRFFLDGLETFLVNHFYGQTLNQLVEGSGITKISYEIGSDMTFLLVAGVLFLLSYVFRYAQELQKLSDETL